MYLAEIFFYLTWPLIAIVSYQAVKFVVKRYEKKVEETSE